MCNPLAKKYKEILAEMGKTICKKCGLRKRLPNLVQILPNGDVGDCELFLQGECPAQIMMFGDGKPEDVFGGDADKK